MDNSEEYASIGEPWEKNEDDQLIREYTVDKLTILEISKIHKRMPGGILSRLKRLNLINMRRGARGYLEYQQSDLYKEICNNKQNKRIENKKKIIVKDDRNDLIELKKEVKEIKETMNKILELMNAVYDFESQ